MNHLTGKNVIITGASRGIGEATARSFAAVGANVTLLARSKVEISKLAQELGPSALAIACDVSDYAAFEQAVEQSVDAFGSVDVLIGNAGVIEPVSSLAEANPTGWSQAIDINLKGVFYGMRAAMPHMLAQGNGTIITVSSGAAHHPLDGWSHYCASKAGAAMLTSCAHLENQAAGIRIMGLSPGTVATQMQREIKASGIGPVAQLAWEDHIPPEWPAQALLWMCGPEADAYLGQEISLRDDVICAQVGLK